LEYAALTGARKCVDVLQGRKKSGHMYVDQLEQTGGQAGSALKKK
jgi:hypothetical protein